MRTPRQAPKVKEAPLIPPEEVLAKTCGGGKGCVVATHLRLCARVLRELRRIFAGTPREMFLTGPTEYLAALHDAGKITPWFQQKIHDAVGEDLALAPRGGEVDHALLSGWILRRRCGEHFAELAASHHGIRQKLDYREDESSERCGGSGWSSLRWEILEEVLDSLGLAPLPSAPSKLTELDRKLEPAVCGAVIIADWLSSGIELPWGCDADDAQVRQKVRSAGFMPLRVRKNLSFEAIFGFSPNALQQLCLNRGTPGEINVIESEMGSGKTEAALYLAYRMLESGSANGIYFALPTQLTSEKIHARLNDFLGKILEDDRAEALLIHGDSWLDWELAVPPHEDFYSSQRPDSWFQSKKRALLAPFGAGTVDQALLAVLNARHNTVRSFGLSGKVVIVDECHSYDSYTGSLLKELIRQLRELRCTVIVLSATLTERARREFSLQEPPSPSAGFQAYPLVSRTSPEGGEELQPFAGSAPRRVKISLTSDESAPFQTAWEKAAAGEQVLWIENTVKRAQEVFRQISNDLDLHPGCETGLIHSRFPRCVRSANEDRWVELLGKRGGDERAKRGRILVGTQVLEQSVDIDADFLITRLAPMDMLLQRTGRLWRHGFLPRPRGAERAVMILTDPLLEEPEKIEEGSFPPYEAYQICRTWEVLRGRDSIELPGEIRPLLESVYMERPEDGPLAALQEKMNSHIEELKGRAYRAQGILAQPCDDIAERSRDDDLNDDRVKTRTNDQPSVQLLLLRKNNGGRPLEKVLLSPFAAEPIVLPQDPHGAEKIAAARAVMRTLITVPEEDAPSHDSFPLDFLAPFLYVGDAKNRPLRAAFLGDGGCLLDRSSLTLEDRRRFYREELGFFTEEK